MTKPSCKAEKCRDAAYSFIDQIFILFLDLRAPWDNSRTCNRWPAEVPSLPEVGRLGKDVPIYLVRTDRLAWANKSLRETDQ